MSEEAVPNETPQLTANIKETIESILVAFILAFIFRAFVVEAFVIPTGSMAPTLLGAHMRFRCPDCGYVFDVNYSSPDASRNHSDDVSIPTEARAMGNIYCPNCGYQVASGPHDRYGSPLDPVMNPNPPPAAWTYGTPFEPVHYGDRILVEKYAYLFTRPSRWDVVVFKTPDDPANLRYDVNYIKRLVGKPGESLMVLDGGIYIQDARNQWQIQQRPPAVQQALWRLIYDNDYYPRGLARSDRSQPWEQPWRQHGPAGWDLGHGAADGRVFRFSAQAESAITFDASAVPCAQTTNDYLVYDIPNNARNPAGGEAPSAEGEYRNVTGDLKLAFWYQRQSGNGSLKLDLGKRDHLFTAEITPDAVTLWHTRPDGTTTADAGPLKLADASISTHSPLWIEFTNVDYQVTLRLNGKKILATNASQYAPDVDRLLREYHGQAAPPGPAQPEIKITAADQTCALSHVSLHRNIYYTNRDLPQRLHWALPDRPVHLHYRGEKRQDGSGVYGEDEYFMMGDNSLVSGDARYWTYPVELPQEDLNVESGRVPARFVLGKAFFVYWPSGYRPITGWPALIPDFGDMRLIH